MEETHAKISARIHEMEMISTGRGRKRVNQEEIIDILWEVNLLYIWKTVAHMVGNAPSTWGQRVRPNRVS